MDAGKRKPPMSRRYLCFLALRTCQWCTAVLHQGKRFLDALESAGGRTPWEENDSSVFWVERVFLITAINHAIVNLECLNDELEQSGDTSFLPVLNAVATKEERQKIRECRNMNEHDIDYMTGQGRKQSQFISKVEKGNYLIETNAFFTYVDGNIGIFLIGNIEIDELLLRFKEKLPEIKAKTSEIFNCNLG